MQSKILVLLLLATVCLCVNKEIAVYFNLLDDNGNGVVTAAEMGLFLDRFHEEHEEIVMTSEIWDNMDTRNSLYKILNATNKFIFQRQQDAEWTLTLEEFEQAIQRFNKIRNGIDVDPICPWQVHQALGDDPQHQVVIMWVTKQNVSSTIVQYSTDQSFSSEATGTSYTYNVGVFGWDYWIHKVQISNLNVGQAYNYRVGNAACWSKNHVFKTAPTNTKYPIDILAFGDMGTFMPMGVAVTEAMIASNTKRAFDIILHVGDISYAGTGKEDEIEGVWDLWAWQVEPLASNIPYMVTVGNHEKYYNWTSFKNRFQMPRSPQVHSPFFYSYDFGPLHIVSLSTEDYVEPFDTGSKQLAWLEQDLKAAAANRANVPWIFVLGHRPMYSSDQDARNWMNAMKTYFEPLMKQYQVDLGIYGHEHCYERTLPVYKNEPTSTNPNVYFKPNATAHLIIGNAGAWIHEKWIEPKPAWSVMRDQFYGFGRIILHNSTHLQFEYTHQHDGSIADTFWLVK